MHEPLSAEEQQYKTRHAADDCKHRHMLPLTSARYLKEFNREDRLAYTCTATPLLSGTIYHRTAVQEVNEVRLSFVKTHSKKD